MQHHPTHVPARRQLPHLLILPHCRPELWQVRGAQPLGRHERALQPLRVGGIDCLLELSTGRLIRCLSNGCRRAMALQDLGGERAVQQGIDLGVVRPSQRLLHLLLHGRRQRSHRTSHRMVGLAEPLLRRLPRPSCHGGRRSNDGIVEEAQPRLPRRGAGRRSGLGAQGDHDCRLHSRNRRRPRGGLLRRGNTRAQEATHSPRRRHDRASRSSVVWAQRSSPEWACS
mmetsp:Transcript_40716/g.117869  ORF Transcript_40716/g.117869 Transcript_40716/m.117869 type:complete len:227 (+) Transcript_40716:1053-1733(+)